MEKNKMSINTSNLKPCHLIYSTVCRQKLSKGLKIRVQRLKRKRRTVKEGREKLVRAVVRKREMEMKNLKMLMENQSIIEENEKLRKKALQLQHENKALLSQLKKLSHSSDHLAHEKKKMNKNKG